MIFQGRLITTPFTRTNYFAEKLGIYGPKDHDFLERLSGYLVAEHGLMHHQVQQLDFYKVAGILRDDWEKRAKASQEQLRQSTSTSPAAVRHNHPPQSNARETHSWKRLKIEEHAGGNDLAILDGEEFRLTGSRSVDFLKQLKAAKGELIRARILSDSLGERSDRIYASLPSKIKCIIDKPGKGKIGYRMR